MTIGRRIKERRRELGMSQVALAKKVGIRQPTISDLESGNTKASTSTALIAHALGVSAMWLETGKGEKEKLDQNVEPVTPALGVVPLISWVKAGSWDDVFDDPEQYEYIPCPVKHGKGTFALEVKGISMYNPNGKDSFADGEIIHVDPNRDAHNGDYVIAMHEGSYEATFKKLVIEDNKKFLMALNPDWSPRLQEITPGTIIRGVVICSQVVKVF